MLYDCCMKRSQCPGEEMNSLLSLPLSTQACPRPHEGIGSASQHLERYHSGTLHA
ncbi:unnamed protein product [Amoebophrya sp. A120]|nr:unnamed protein product [Amoebophrya sp. A120]|eukprot:GSA120T00006453001.1